MAIRRRLTSNATFLYPDHCWFAVKTGGGHAKEIVISGAGLRTFNTVFSAFSQGYPSRPITIVVPFAAGGPTKTLARILAQRMTVSFGQSVIIENVTGAAGSIAVVRVVRSSPDGYTLSIGHVGTHVLNRRNLCIAI